MKFPIKLVKPLLTKYPSREDIKAEFRNDEIIHIEQNMIVFTTTPVPSNHLLKEHVWMDGMWKESARSLIDRSSDALKLVRQRLQCHSVISTTVGSLKTHTCKALQIEKCMLVDKQWVTYVIGEADCRHEANKIVDAHFKELQQGPNEELVAAKITAEMFNHPQATKN